ncbi:helix-turn-helix transcriptional regulator [Horticoccus luteus]|uniref:Helix-turn-helix transcriptional regulator n=1 Tax=Horticoccus luteus TaxID=2862869 RepID=A0A8F9TTW7_9BACT|nr:helix-turn-helix transcriptional regulator [Horticoccus luteus]QYM78960.1 helix-turn-helix transcriptional regulator [Horticoccus luteus]
MAKTKARELERFGSNVRKLREAKEWTQEELAEKAGLDQTYISGIERGERNLTILSIAKLARALAVAASELCKGIDR